MDGPDRWALDPQGTGGHASIRPFVGIGTEQDVLGHREVPPPVTATGDVGVSESRATGSQSTVHRECHAGFAFHWKERELTLKIALIENISRKTAQHLHQYLTDFTEGTARLLWTENRVYVEVARGEHADLLRRQFPTLIEDRVRYTGATFPW